MHSRSWRALKGLKAGQKTNLSMKKSTIPLGTIIPAFPLSISAEGGNEKLERKDQDPEHEQQRSPGKRANRPCPARS